MVPCVGVSRPFASLIKVLFPLPFGPNRPTIRPFGTVRSTLLSAKQFGKNLTKPRHSKMFSMNHSSLPPVKCRGGSFDRSTPEPA